MDPRLNDLISQDILCGNQGRLDCFKVYYTQLLNTIENIFKKDENGRWEYPDLQADRDEGVLSFYEQFQCLILNAFLVLKSEHTDIDMTFSEKLFSALEVCPFDEEVAYFKDIVYELIVFILYLKNKAEYDFDAEGRQIINRIKESQYMLEFIEAFYDIHCGHVFRQEDIESIPIVKELNDLLMN